MHSGTLSTVSSGVNSLSAVGWEEFLRPFLEARNGGQPLSDARATFATKVFEARREAPRFYGKVTK